MAKKVVATLRNTSGVKYAKLIRSKKSDKTGAYQFKEEIVIEDHVKDILAGKDQVELIEEMRSKQDKQAPKEEAKRQKITLYKVSIFLDSPKIKVTAFTP